MWNLAFLNYMYTTEHTEDDLHTVTTTYPVAMHFPTVHNGWHYTQTVHINTFIPKKNKKMKQLKQFTPGSEV